MKPGSDVAIDECIEGFEGRGKEAVNIPSKPTPMGFKQWVLASDGYFSTGCGMLVAVASEMDLKALTEHGLMKGLVLLRQ
jgi:Transposase IS4